MTGRFEIDGLGKAFPGSPALTVLDDIQLDIAPGEFVCIVGPSGCGKSTLLEILAGLTLPSCGEVRLDGAPVRGPSRDIGIVFQNPALFPWRTLQHNVELGMEIRAAPLTERRRRALEALEGVGLGAFAGHYPHQVSGGMKQRAGLARMLVNAPKVLLLDEPFGAVDHLTRIRLQEDLLELWARDRKTTVLITHDVGEAVFLADRVVLLSPRPGRIHSQYTVTSPRPRRRDSFELVELQASIEAEIRAFDHLAGNAIGAGDAA